MELSIREAATLLGRSARTVRDQVRRGDILARKRQGKWVLASENLPLTGSQRRALQGKAEDVRQAVEDALPSRGATRRGHKGRSVLDTVPFRLARPVMQQLTSAATQGDRRLQCAARDLESGMLSLAEAIHQFRRDAKLRALDDARCHLSHAAAHLAMTGDAQPEEPALGWLSVLEQEVLPALGGLSRWAERLPEGKR